MGTNTRLIAREAGGYALVSAVAFAADLCLLLVTARYMHYLAAATLSFLVGGLVAYGLSVRYVFRHRRIARRSVEMTAFIALGLVGLAVNVAVIGIAVGQWSLPLVVAKLFAGCGTFASNFILRRWALFSGTDAIS
jgi:putative flippase GtrA